LNGKHGHAAMVLKVVDIFYEQSKQEQFWTPHFSVTVASQVTSVVLKIMKYGLRLQVQLTTVKPL